MPTSEPRGRRALIKIHPACMLLPSPTADELAALTEDIRAHGLRMPIVFWHPGVCRTMPPPLETVELIDGRSRLDALELAGLPVMPPPDFALQLPDDKVQFIYADDNIDPWQFALSVNLHRRVVFPDSPRLHASVGVCLAVSSLSL